MICKKCGCRVNDAATFCDKCGAPMAEFGQKETPKPTPKLTANSKKLLIASLAVLALILVCVGGLLFESQQKRNYANRAAKAIREDEGEWSSIDEVYVYEKTVSVDLKDGSKYICNMLTTGGVQVLTRYNYPTVEEKKTEYFNDNRNNIKEKGTAIPISDINPLYR